MSPDRVPPTPKGVGVGEGQDAEGSLREEVGARGADPVGYTIANISYAIAELAQAAAELGAQEPNASAHSASLSRARAGLSVVADALQEARHGADRVRQLVRDLREQARESGVLHATTPTPAPVATAPGTCVRARVLVVDDEPMMVRAIARLLDGEHDVISSTDPVEVVAQIEAGNRYDAILCDLMMPAMSGMDAFEAIRRIAPEQARRVVFMTGGAHTAPVVQFLHSVENLRIEKPLERATLRALLRAQLTAVT